MAGTIKIIEISVCEKRGSLLLRHIYDMPFIEIRSVTQWSVHLRRTLHNVFRTWPSLRLDSASLNSTMCLDKPRVSEGNVSLLTDCRA